MAFVVDTGQTGCPGGSGNSGGAVFGTGLRQQQHGVITVSGVAPGRPQSAHRTLPVVHTVS